MDSTPRAGGGGGGGEGENLCFEMPLAACEPWEIFLNDESVLLLKKHKTFQKSLVCPPHLTLTVKAESNL